MTTFKRIASLLLALFPTLAHGQTPPSEALNRPANPGFVMGYTAENRGVMIEEWVPKGETVENWNKMVTFQRLENFKSLGNTAFSAANSVATLMIRTCSSATSTAINMPALDGMSIAEFSTYCPLNSATGKPETTFFKFIAGERDIHVAQVAFRRVARGGDRKWAHAFLGSVKLCSAENVQPDCGAMIAAR